MKILTPALLLVGALALGSCTTRSAAGRQCLGVQVDRCDAMANWALPHIIKAGYSCGQITWVGVRRVPGFMNKYHMQVVCDGRRYRYSFIQEGGRWSGPYSS